MSEMSSKNPYPHIEAYNYDYSPSKWSHRYGEEEVIQAHIKCLTDNSALAKTTAGIIVEEGVRYGDGEKQMLDIYTGVENKPGAPIFMYIHGGYWQLLSRELSGFVAKTFVEAGATVVTTGYDLAPQVDMPTIVSEVRAAAQYVLNMAKEKGSSGVYLCGHSAGAHLAAMILSDKLQHQELVKGAVLVSGIYNTEPLCYSYVNDPIGMTKEVAVANSPVTYAEHVIRNYSERGCRVIVTVADHDPTSFIQQSEEYHKVLKDGGINSEYDLLQNHDHFTAIEQLVDPDAALTKKVKAMMGLA